MQAQLSAANALIVTILVVLSNDLIMSMSMAGMKEDRDALLEFIKGADPRGLMAKNWTGSDPCAGSWDGVVCNKGRVWHLILESRQLGGLVASISGLANLDQLRKVSLTNNMLSGTMPSFQSPFLRCVWLSNNSLSGSIPDIFSHTKRFNKLDVSHNALTGGIPTSLVSIVKLHTLLLNDNQLSGSIPPLNQGDLATFSVSNNHLSGPIPSTSKLQTFSINSYLNNQNLCGPPLSLPCNNKKAMSTVLKILLIVAIDVLLLCFMSLLAVYCYKRLQRRKKERAKQVKDDPSIQEETGRTYDKAGRNEEMTEAEKSKLVVFDRPGRLSFDLGELLQASAELLGKGSCGTAYKAMFGGPNGRSAVVVKRLRDMQMNGTSHAGKREFDRQMLLLGQLQHPNIVPILAYYYAKDEKFLVIEHVGWQGTLYSLLHHAGPGCRAVPILGWDARLKIARGVARGMAYLHMALNSMAIPHGNLKSSNVLLDEGMVPKVADFGMVPLFTQSAAQGMAAFKAPEYAANKTITPHADVYSFGIILLELLTGKPAPVNSSFQGEIMDLQKWVCSRMEQAPSQLYDVDMAKEAKEEEMEAMLKLAMMCIRRDVEERPSMEEALRMVEAIRIVDSPTWLEVDSRHNMVMDSPGTNSLVSDYNTPAHSLSSHRSSFQHILSPM